MQIETSNPTKNTATRPTNSSTDSIGKARKTWAASVEHDLERIAIQQGWNISPLRGVNSKEWELTRQDRQRFGTNTCVYISRFSGVAVSEFHVVIAPEVWEARMQALQSIEGIQIKTKSAEDPWYYSSNYRGFANKQPGKHEHYGKKLIVFSACMSTMAEILSALTEEG
jgi:hypothetical protein